ncbi:branched-chain amino acid ABC transporter permease [Cypionkella psychrotolerans]|uniref:branched-chain amino acid ABC transporter permease n=1 Tax=Cypionkella psychrotolerans TaxID=1678131 RepID=UPI0006B621D8|nr:branched-chain amino acid ABC transporter permease [Cypionkella psychrotolerans]
MSAVVDTPLHSPNYLRHWPLAAVLLIAFIGMPAFAPVYVLEAILLPFLALALAGVGLNLLTGYGGQVSLGSAAFMAVGAFAAYNIQLRLALPLPITLLLSALTAAAVGLVFGLPSLRLRGFYLAVSTLAAQFFVQWALTKFGWFSNYSPSGVISAPSLSWLGYSFDSTTARYLLALSLVTLITLGVWAFTHGPLGNDLIAIRDNETAAQIIGVPVLKTKLVAFAVSSAIIGVAGFLWAFTYLRTVEPAGFDLDRSFDVLFIIIIGGLATLRGAFLGAGLIVVFPLLLSRLSALVFGGMIDSGVLELVQRIILGVLIIAFLIAEPNGLAAILDRVKRKSARNI